MIDFWAQKVDVTFDCNALSQNNKANGYLLGQLYENNDYKVTLCPDFQVLKTQSKPQLYTGLTLAMKFK